MNIYILSDSALCVKVDTEVQGQFKVTLLYYMSYYLRLEVMSHLMQHLCLMSVLYFILH